VAGATGTAQRFRFDPAELFAQRAAEAERVRPTIQLLQNMPIGGISSLNEGNPKKAPEPEPEPFQPTGILGIRG
jgi:hypothetical protein